MPNDYLDSNYVLGQQIFDQIKGEAGEGFAALQRQLGIVGDSDAKRSANTLNFIIENIKTFKLLGYIDPSRIHPEDFGTFLYHFWRGLDENLATPMRNVQVFMQKMQNGQDPGFMQNHTAMGVFAGLGIVISSAYLIAEYRRGKHRAELRDYAAVTEKIDTLYEDLVEHLPEYMMTNRPINKRSRKAAAARPAPLVETSDSYRGVIGFTTNVKLHDEHDENVQPEALLLTSEQRLVTKAIKKMKKLQNICDDLNGPERFIVFPIIRDRRISFIFVKNRTLDNKPEPQILLSLWEKKIYELNNSWAGDVIHFIYKSFGTYSMAYWLVWMGIYVATGAAVAMGMATLPLILAFAIPLVPMGLYMLWNLVFFKDKKKDEIKSQEDAAAKLVMLDYAIYKLSNRLKDTFTVAENLENRSVRASIPAAERLEQLRAHYGLAAIQFDLSAHPQVQQRVAQVKELTSRLRGQQLSGSKIDRGFRAGFFSFVSNFIGLVFIGSAITDFLSIALHAPMLAMASTHPAMLISIVVASVLIAGYMAVSHVIQARKNHNDQMKSINDFNKDINNQDVLDHLENLAQRIAEKEVLIAKIRETIAQVQQSMPQATAAQQVKIAALNKAAQPIHFPKFDGRKEYVFGAFTVESDRFFRRLDDKPSRWATFKTVFKKGVMRVLAFIDGAGAGSFIARFATTAVIAILIPALATPHAWPIILGVAIGIGIVMGIAKVYRYHMSQKQERDDKFLDEIQIRTKCAEEELSILEHQESYLVSQLATLAADAPAPVALQPQREELMSDEAPLLGKETQRLPALERALLPRAEKSSSRSGVVINKENIEAPVVEKGKERDGSMPNTEAKVGDPSTPLKNNNQAA